MSRELLTSVDKSLLKKKFKKDVNNQKQASEEEVFLDRDPAIFDMMLNYLRHETNYTPKDVSKETKRLFDIEIKYWGVASSDYYQK